jgi:pSer/pThr/pTyr-binding forkhead associated (FHA) protein
LRIDTENSGVQINVGHETIQRVVNQSGSTITKGKVVYIDGQSGNRPLIQLADNTADATSANTVGLVIADINHNANGYIITNGLLENINTIGYNAGQTLYLSTSGNFTNVKPIAPNHLVYVGKVISVGTTGSIFVTIQNGYELDELHDVLITSPTNDQVLTYETSSGLWKNKTPQTGNGLPSQTGQSGKYLTTNGTTASWNTLPTQIDSWHLSAGFTNFTLGANETYIFGHMFGASQPVTPINARASRQMIAPKSGFLKKVSIMTAASSFSSVSPPDSMQIQVRIGTASPYTIVAAYSMSSGSFSGQSRQALFTGFNFACNEGDIVKIYYNF